MNRHAFTTDGNVANSKSGRGKALAISAACATGDLLRVEIRDADDRKITETYELIAGGDRLHVTVELVRDGWRPPFELRRVYDRADETANGSIDR